MFDEVKRGEIEGIKKQEQNIGLDVQYLCDDQLKQNAMFSAMLIRDEQKSIQMSEWLVSKGCQLHFTDVIN